MYCEDCGRLLNRATGRCVCEDDGGRAPVNGHTGDALVPAAAIGHTDTTTTAPGDAPNEGRPVPAPPPEPKWTLETEDEWRARTASPGDAPVVIGATPPAADPGPGTHGGWPPAPAPPVTGSGPSAAWPAAAPREQSKQAVTALVLSILSWVICPGVLAIGALVAAARAKRQIRASYGRVDGEGMATASQVIAALNLVAMVVFIPLMLAIAIPTFQGAQARAQDRAAQSQLRAAMTAEKVHFTSAGRFTANPAELLAIDPKLRFEAGATPVVEGPVYVHAVEQLVGLSTKSASGTCFYLAAIADDPELGYASDPSCGSVEVQDYRTAWP